MSSQPERDKLGVGEAKARFSELIDRVGRGERFVVHRRGRPVLALVPPGEADRARPEPEGLLSVIGALADHDEELDAMVKDIYRGRRRARDRPVPAIE